MNLVPETPRGVEIAGVGEVETLGAVPAASVAAASTRYELRAIGVVRSALRAREDAPKQGDEGAPEASLVFDPEVVVGLRDIRAGDSLILLTWLHEADRSVLAVHPRDDLARPVTGVFSTRSSDRPNPIGLHRVLVVGVSEAGLRVDGLEAIDGTPVLDVKPVLGA